MMRSHRWLALAASVAVFSLARTADAQVPLGVEFRVNTYTTGAQFSPSAAAAADGSALVVWQHRLSAIVTRAYDPSGAPRGGEVVASAPGPVPSRPWVAARPAGFVTVWTDYGSEGSFSGIVGRLQDPLGSGLGPPFQVNTYTTGVQDWARVAADAAGNFVVVWGSYGPTGGSYGIFGRRFDPAGTPLGGEFQVNSYGTGYPELPAVAMAGDGRFVVAWTDNGIQARRYDAQGNPAGLQFAVAPPMPNAQGYPALAMQASGGFLVAWNRNDEDAPGTEAVQARLFDATGAPRGAEFRVNQVVTADQGWPALCADADGNFSAVWESQGQDGDATGIFARRIGARGTPMGAEFQVNTYTSDFQARSTIACDPGGNVVVSWDSFGQDGSGFGVYARRFGRFDPHGLEVDAKSGNGVFEPGETAEVATAWRNFARQGFGPVTGNASAFTGPPGATYTIADGIANYGTVGAGEAATCELFEDCFALSVNAPPTRPVTHWDGQFVETLTIGRIHAWKVHLGGSFDDVAISSPFYRFIETVLHNGVTAGCQAASYCPAATTSREQMPVMVLVAREGAGYQPPACQPGSEAFTDVPASSPFCRWIEELARRGVVGGCAQGTYCPGAPVSREQMAVFVLATREAPGYVPPPCASPGMFGDVPASSPFCRWIEELARRGVVSGCGNGNYCPSAAVTREQMSVFVTAGFGLTLYGP